jgi:hypothetical protein
VKYHYFVSYFAGNAFGNAQMFTNMKLNQITTMPAVSDWARSVERQYDLPKGTCVILNIQLLGEERA